MLPGHQSSHLSPSICRSLARPAFAERRDCKNDHLTHLQGDPMSISSDSSSRTTGDGKRVRLLRADVSSVALAKEEGPGLI